MKKDIFNVVPFSGVSVIIGVVDEAIMIRKTIETVLATCNSEDIEEFVIMQSQRITPECVESIQRLKQEITDVPINTYVESKPGVGMAIRDGIVYSKGSHMAFMSSDFGIHPECLSRLIVESKKYPDRVIKTSRWEKNGSFEGYGKIRLVANKLGNLFLSALYHTRISDISSATQLFPSDLYKRIKWDEEDFSFLLEMSLKPLRLGVKFSQVYAACLPRIEGKSNNSIKKTLAYFPTALKYRFMPVSKFYDRGNKK